MIQLIQTRIQSHHYENGKKIDYHASIKFDNDINKNMTDDQRDTLHSERNEYQENQGKITMEAISALSRKCKDK